MEGMCRQRESARLLLGSNQLIRYVRAARSAAPGGIFGALNAFSCQFMLFFAFVAIE